MPAGAVTTLYFVVMHSPLFLTPFLLLLAAIFLPANLSLADELNTRNPAPAFKQPDQNAWINSEPLDWEALQGKVVLLNVWTYGCSNCRRSLPWLKSVYSKYQAQGLEIVGYTARNLPGKNPGWPLARRSNTMK